MAVGQSDFLIVVVVVDPEIAVANESNLKTQIKKLILDDKHILQNYYKNKFTYVETQLYNLG